MTAFAPDMASGLFAAIGQPTRLEILRVLAPVSQGEESPGMAAGEIARLLDVAPTSLSFHLKDMTYKGLLVQERQGRSMIYRADVALLLQALDYLSAEIRQT